MSQDIAYKVHFEALPGNAGKTLRIAATIPLCASETMSFGVLRPRSFNPLNTQV